MMDDFIDNEFYMLEKELDEEKAVNGRLLADLYNAEDEILDFKNQEQSLLWTLYSILDGLAVEGEAREKAINEFKKHLKYYKGN